MALEKAGIYGKNKIKTRCHGVKLITDKNGFNLQLIDLICKYDAHLVLDMLLLNPIHDINYVFCYGDNSDALCWFEQKVSQKCVGNNHKNNNDTYGGICN